MIKNKRGELELHGIVSFIILLLIFFSGMFYFVSWFGKRVAITEQTYAKQIALLINQAKPNTVLEIDTFKLEYLAKKHDYSDRLKDIIKIDYETGEVTIKLSKGGGYNYKFFTKLNDGSLEFDEENHIMKIKV